MSRWKKQNNILARLLYGFLTAEVLSICHQVLAGVFLVWWRKNLECSECISHFQVWALPYQKKKKKGKRKNAKSIV